MTKTLIKILREDQRPFRRLIAVAIRRSHLGRFMRIKVHDYCIRFHPTALSESLWYNPMARQGDYEFLTAFLKKGDTYIDIGANVGTTIIPAAKSVGETSKVIAFEPHPRICSYLKDNVQLNDLPNVEIHNIAIGNKRGCINFSDKRHDTLNEVLLSGSGIQTPIELLDDLNLSYSRINLIKIDVEGYEKFVIEGGRKTLEKTDCIYVELSEKNFRKYDYNARELLKLLEDLGFIVFKRVKPTAIVRLGRKHTYGDRAINIIGVKNIEEFMARTRWHII